MAKQQFSADEPVQVFRQFAWHLAGSIAASGAKSGAGKGTAKPRPAQGAGKAAVKR